MQEYQKRFVPFKIALLYFILFQAACLAQSGTSSKDIVVDNPDSVYVIARELAFSGNYEAARSICYEILDNYKNYHDFSILAARTLAWQSEFDSARTVILTVLNEQPSNKAALLVMADIEMWENFYSKALDYVDTGLYYYPEDSVLVNKRAAILQRMNESKSFVPESGFLGKDTNSIGLSYFFDFFKSPYIARRHMFSLQYARRIHYGPLLSRLNVGENVLGPNGLFYNPSYQVEADYYPKITDNAYLYINYGLATGIFFPSHRAGFEWFNSIGEEMEGSIGIRYLFWDRSILFFTASIARYFDNYWVSVRPYFSPLGSNNTFTLVLELRRYLKDSQSYIFASASFGDSPDQPLNLAEEFGNFISTHYRLGIRYRLNDWYVGAGIGYQYEEYFPGLYRNRMQFNLSAAYVF